MSPGRIGSNSTLRSTAPSGKKGVDGRFLAGTCRPWRDNGSRNVANRPRCHPVPLPTIPPLGQRAIPPLPRRPISPLMPRPRSIRHLWRRANRCFHRRAIPPLPRLPRPPRMNRRLPRRWAPSAVSRDPMSYAPPSRTCREAHRCLRRVIPPLGRPPRPPRMNRRAPPRWAPSAVSCDPMRCAASPSRTCHER